MKIKLEKKLDGLHLTIEHDGPIDNLDLSGCGDTPVWLTLGKSTVIQTLDQAQTTYIYSGACACKPQTFVTGGISQ